MMDERQIREEAWLEGVYAVTGLSPETALTVPNPYAPVVEYTPSLVEMNAVLLSKFSQLEVWRGQKQRENQLAEHVRVMVVEELEVMKLRERRIYEEELQALNLRRSHIISLPERGFLDSRARDGAVGDCIAVIKRMKG
jgi:hypothetical protein